jgi:fructose-bisphosphate aldolase, class II
MIFTPLTEVLGKAKIGKYAVGAFNIHNLETIKAITEAAKCEKSPVILATSPNAIKFSGIEYIHQIAKVAAIESEVPVVLHLDHGTSFRECIQCIRHGWSSVMFDGSKLPLSENIAKTREIVKIAHAAGISVEGELGTLAGAEDQISIEEREAMLTNPGDAERFVQETDVDALAIAIGTSHGAFKFKGKADLDFDRLKKIEGLVKIPIVLHGASGVPSAVLERAVKYGSTLSGAIGVPDEDIKKSISLGVAKINIATDIRLTMITALRQELYEHPAEFDPVKIFGPVENAVKDVAIQKMKLFNSSGKA